MNNINTEIRYTAAQVCAVTGVSPELLKSWVSRKPIIVHVSDDDREKQVKGSPIMYTFTRVMQIAITKKLVDSGLSARRAAVIAAGFTDTGRAPPPAHVMQDALYAKAKYRLPGELFRKGWTVLIGDTENENVPGRCVCIDPDDDSAKEVFSAIFFGSGDGRGTPRHVVWVNPIYQQVRERLAGGVA